MLCGSSYRNFGNRQRLPVMTRARQRLLGLCGGPRGDSWGNKDILHVKPHETLEVGTLHGQ